MRCFAPRFSGFPLLRFQYVAFLLQLTVFGHTESLFRRGEVNQAAKRRVEGEGKSVKSRVKRLLVTGKGT
jgi:hypothetical protein